MLNRTVGLAIAVVLAVVGVVGAAAAQTPVPTPEPRQARRLDVMLVPEYRVCPQPGATPDIPSLREFPAPCASEAPLTVQGCSHPVLDDGECRFDPRIGKGRLKAKAIGTDVLVDATLQGIVGCESDELEFFANFRLTESKCSNGVVPYHRCTVQMSDWNILNPTCTVTADGKCRVKTRVNNHIVSEASLYRGYTTNLELLSAGFRHVTTDFRYATVFRAGILVPVVVPNAAPTPTLDHPREAKLARVDLVTGHRPCLSPNDATYEIAHLDACSPPELNDPVCRFGSNGRGWGRAQSIGGPDVRFEVDVQGIDLVDTAGRLPTDPMYAGCEGQRLCLTSSVRITSNDCVPGVTECTTEEVADAVIGKGHPDHPYAGCCIVSGGRCHVETTLNALSDPADPLVKPGKLSIGGFLAGGLKRDASLCPGEPGYGDPPPDGPAFVPGLFLP